VNPASVAGALAAVASLAMVAAARAFTAPGALAGRVGSLVEPPVKAAPPQRPPGRRAAKQRRRRVDAHVPQLLDLLAAGSSAGLSAELALRRAAEALPGPLGDELRTVFAHADLGDRWRAGLAGLATSSGSADLRRTVAVLERTENLGSSLVDATRDLAATVRHARRTATLERARTAPVKMLFPLVFLILPAFLLLTVVPVLLTTVRSIR
jgi:tight adherence protein C